ncbi:MAG TPA: O-antigen ligase family protein [Bacteroidales bacterium]|nr:O-antigen ligase family protein [Bacteroidales bacterium]
MNRKKLIVLGVSAAFILLNCFALMREFLYLPIISAGLILVYLLIFKVDFLVYLMALVTPFSIFIENDKINLSISFPGELIMISLTVLFLIRILYDLKIERQILKHPLTIAILCYLFWIFVTSITSELPLVSFKFLASKIWFIVACFFMVVQLIKKDTNRIVHYFNAYLFSLALVIIIVTIKSAQLGFMEHGMHWIQKPFYNDHTAYGAAIAFFIPITVSFFFLPQSTKWLKIYYIGILAILMVGLYFSFCRAAWLSVIGSLGVYLAIRWRIKFSWLVLGGTMAVALFFFFASDILYQMGKNKQDSSATFTEHLQSMGNISTDASNVERLNRWFSAFGMIEERPIVGWGPGTYQFEYAPFQKNKYKTIISTNFGNGGNCHSEYIGPTAETGFIGLITVLSMLILVIYTGIKTHLRSKDPRNKILSLAATLALISYYIHGIMNNFLDTDKLSLPFWGAFAIILVINLIETKNVDFSLQEQKNIKK